MPASLLDSQFAALEAPRSDEFAVTVAINQPLVEIVQELTEVHREAATKQKRLASSLSNLKHEIGL